MNDKALQFADRIKKLAYNNMRSVNRPETNAEITGIGERSVTFQIGFNERKFAIRVTEL